MKAYFDSQNEKFKKPFGAVPVKGKVSFFIEADGFSECRMRVWDDEEGEAIRKMEKVPGGFALSFSAPPSGRLLWYHFVLTCGDGSVWRYGNNDLKAGGAGVLKADLVQDYQITVYREFSVPDWYKNSIVYQIFPDRFARDADSAKRAGRLKVNLADWNEVPTYERDSAGGVLKWDFYGGSLNGIREKLLYLRSLGVGAIYLNPIFKAVSNHRYDTCDFFKVDPLLGTEEDFVSLCKEASGCGIRIILDGVFSHVGADSIYFRDRKKYGKWFKFDSSEIGYKAWWGDRNLPEVNELEPSYSEFICGKGGVIEHWLGKGASGFRIDVADELPDAFLRLVRKAVKRCGKDKVLVGEVWEDASNKESYGEKRRFLMGEELDCVMDYPLRRMCLDYATGAISSSRFQQLFMCMMENYPKESFYSNFNLLSSHDRERVLSYVSGSRENVKLLYALLFALPGVPVIYYGDELSMTGLLDPENRKAMDWSDSADYDMHYHFRMLKVLYGEHPVLKDGDYIPVDFSDDDVFAFLRKGGKSGETVLVVANRNPYCGKMLRFASGCVYALELMKSREFFAENGEFGLECEPCSTRIFLLKERNPETDAMERKAGVLCPLFSIPGGKLGKGARCFIDWLHSAGIGIWQMLPINPVGLGDSPYLSGDAFAVNPDFIAEDELPPAMKGKTAAEKFAYQWKDMHDYARKKGIVLVGDIPIYVDGCGKDTARDPKCFQLDSKGKAALRAGVPPDYFQKDGQDWGNPLYDWEYLKAHGYEWWIRRLEFVSGFFDYVRLDHFRGFSEYFAIPQGAKPSGGSWISGPGADFFREVKKRLPSAKFIAEDLGSLDDAVFNLLKLTGLPGMNVWQFSFDEMRAMDARAASGRIFYSGTHDNQTLLSWCGGDKEKASGVIVELLASKAPWAIFQLQDLLLLDDSARINVPGTVGGNWKWRCDAKLLTAERAKAIRRMVVESGRI